jgi:hypothetical protein
MPYGQSFGFELCLKSDHGVTYGFGASVGGIGIQTETDHTVAVEQCVESDTSNGMTNEDRADVVDGENDNKFWVLGRQSYRSARIRRIPRACHVLRLLKMRPMHRLVPAGAALAATAGLVSGCTAPSGPQGREATVFETAQSSALTDRGTAPTDTILNFGMPLYNLTHGVVRVVSARLVSPSGPGVRLISVTAYSNHLAPIPLGFQGNLPKTCPEMFKPHPVAGLVVRPRYESKWILVVALELSKPGRYQLGVLKISYQTAGHHGWQLYYDAVTIDVVPAKSNPEYVNTFRCGPKTR